MNATMGHVCGIAYRPEERAAMRAVDDCAVQEKRGLTLEDRNHGKREITLLSQQAWSEICRELGQDISWTTRRANLLVADIDLSRCIGNAIEVGDVRLFIHGETKPCQLMDEQIPGLRQALRSNCRGGVHGQVTRGGTIRVGDSISIHPGNPESIA
jgi:MOSC domain-containing protein YiiM